MINIIIYIIYYKRLGEKQCQEQNSADTLYNCVPRQPESNVEMIGDDECMFGHEETDLNMVNYALKMSREHGCQQIQIVSDDDVFVRLVHLSWKLRPLAAIPMKRFDGNALDMNAIVMALGDECVQLLPMHATLVATACRTRLER